MMGSLEYRLKVGKTTLGLICHSASFAESLQDYFRIPSAMEEPDLQIELEFVGDEWPTKIPNNLFTSKKLSENGFSIANDLIRGNYDPQSRSGYIKVNSLLARGPNVRVFEQFLYQTFYSARKAIGYDAFLIHSSGVIQTGDNGQQEGFLFVGASGTGKSTVANLSTKYLITNDEMNLIEFGNDGPTLHATPFNGLFHGKEVGISAPLRGIMLLDQGLEHVLTEVNQRAAVVLLASQISPPVGMEEEMGQSSGLDLLEMADKLSTAAPVRKMTFLPDPGFWKIINEAFPPGEASLKRS